MTVRLREVMELPQDLPLPTMISDEAIRTFEEKLAQELEQALFTIMQSNLVVSNQKSHQFANDLE